jgi:excisionase family DNA binding protein
MHEIDRRLLTVAEAAEMLNLSRAEAYRMVQRNELPSARFGKFGKLLRVPVSAVDAVIAERLRQQAQMGG